MIKVSKIGLIVETEAGEKSTKEGRRSEKDTGEERE